MTEVVISNRLGSIVTKRIFNFILRPNKILLLSSHLIMKYTFNLIAVTPPLIILF